MIRAVVTDIEGTTTPIRFVKETLFPYAARALPAFIEVNRVRADVAELLADVAREAGIDRNAPTSAYVDVLERWIAEDRKITPLKSLQGLIWRDGYEHGTLRAPVYDDAARKLRQWHADGLALYVYSSGSVEAQKLLFAHTDHGDMTDLFSGYFDTTTGPKKEHSSYGRMVEAIGLAANECLFLSDDVDELDAAAEAGLATVRLIRPDDVANPSTSTHAQVLCFDEVRL